MPQLRDLKKGDFFKRKEDGKTVWVKGHYIRESKRFSCHPSDDMNYETFIPAIKQVFIEFEF